MNTPSNLKYAASHEWIRPEPDGSVTIGITDHAQEALGDIVYLELPAIGRTLKTNEACAVIESVKAASDIYAPIAGRIVEVNGALADNPGLVNASAFEEGWFFRIEPADASALAGLMDEAGYAAYLETL